MDSLKGATGFGYTTVQATRVDGGFCLNGRKAFGTNSPVGNLFGSTAIYHDPVEGDVNLLFIIPKDTPGLVCQHDWDTLGMRASASHSWVFQDLFVADEAVIRRKPWEWDEYVRGIWAWHGGTFCTIYLGIARAARDFAVEYTKTRTRIPFHHPESSWSRNRSPMIAMKIQNQTTNRKISRTVNSASPSVKSAMIMRGLPGLVVEPPPAGGSNVDSNRST